MHHRTWSILPLLAALLACKSGRNIAPEQDNAVAEPAPSSATPDTSYANAAPSRARAGGRVPLPLVEGRARTEHGFVIIPGEVKNDTGKWLRSVHIDVELLDASGKPIHVDSIAAADGRKEGVVADRSVLPPGEVALFRYTRDMKKLAAGYASHRLSASGRVGDEGMSATVENVHTSRDDLGFFTVTGRLKSSGTSGCRSPQALIGLYASDGKVYDVTTAGLDEWFQKVMPNGQTAEFSRRAIDGRDGVFSDIKVWGDCQL